MGHHQLDALDEQILKLIAGNARIPFLEVARACNVPARCNPSAYSEAY